MRALYAVQVVSMLIVSAMQFGNAMILTGPLLSFIAAALLLMFAQVSDSPSPLWSASALFTLLMPAFASYDYMAICVNVYMYMYVLRSKF